MRKKLCTYKNRALCPQLEVLRHLVDSHGELLHDNFRPTQPLNDRQVRIQRHNIHHISIVKAVKRNKVPCNNRIEMITHDMFLSLLLSIYFLTGLIRFIPKNIIRTSSSKRISSLWIRYSNAIDNNLSI